MPLKDYINKEGYIETVAGIGATLAGQATDTATERELPWLTQTQIALEVTVAFNALADGGLRVRILEYMTTATAATVATPGNEGTIPLDAGSTVRQTFLFTVRSRYYLIELFNLDSAAGRDAGSIAVQIIENPEGVQGQDGQTQTHTQYWDGEAWQPQLIMAWETGGNLDRITASVEIMDDWDESDRAKVNIIVGQAGITANAGAVAANTPRMTLASDDPAVVALQIIDDWDESDRAKVNPIVGQAGIAAGAGAVGVTVPRVTLASDDPAVTALEIIDDWDESDRAKVNLIVGQAGIAAGAGAVGVTVPRVTLASDDPAVTALEIIDDWDESDRAKVNPIVGQAGIAAGAGAVGVTVPRVTLASDDPAVTALEIIDDWDEGDRAMVNLIVGQAGIAAGAGAVGVTVPRVTLASDDPAVTALQIIDDWDESDRAAVNPERDIAIDEMDATTGWAVANDATINLATTANHISGTNALEFDKVDGSGFTEAYIEKTLSSLELEHFEAHTIIEFAVYLSSLTDVAYAFIRLGDDNANYNEYRVTDDNLTAGVWNSVAIPASQAQYPSTGTGINAADVDYVAVGVSFDAENDALADIAFDRLHIHSSLHTFATLGAEVSTIISTANVNVQKIGNQVINRGAGAVALGTQRTTLASDDPAVTALEIIDDWDESDRAKVNPIVGQAGIAAGAGAVGVTVPRVTLASDDPGVTALEIIDDWDESDRAKVNPIVGQAGIAAGAGAVGVTVPRVTLASDDPAVTALQIIDDWDETDRAAVNLIAGQVGVQAGAGAVNALTQRMILATDDPAVTSLAIIDDWDETDRAAVNLIAGQVAITAGAGAVAANTPRMTLASDDPAVTALEKIDGMSTLADAVETALTQVVKTVAAIGTPEAIAGAGTLFRRATLIAKKAARVANAGVIYLGVTAGNDTQPIPLNPGEQAIIEAPPGEKYDWDNWYVDVTVAADGIIVIYS